MNKLFARQLFLIPFITFFVLHIVSYATFGYISLLREIIFLFILFFSLFLGLKNINWLLGIVAIELLAGSSGGLFEYNNISLRLALLALLLTVYAVFHARKHPRKGLFLGLSGVFVTLTVLGAFRGVLAQNTAQAIFADTVPVLFLLMAFPLSDFFKKYTKEEIFAMLYWLVLGAVWAVFLGTLILFILYSSGAAVLQAPLYDWIRNWLAGKITFLGEGYYRIVIPFFLPISILTPWMFWYSMRILKKWPGRIAALTPFFALPAFHLSRGLILGIAAGFFVFIFFKKWKEMFALGITFAAGFVLSFALIHFVASSGQSFGFNTLFGRGAGVIEQGVEESADTRRLLFKPLVQSIRDAPFFGHGLGFMVSYYNPYVQKMISTSHLDWGYLELLTEGGIVPTILLFLSLVWLVVRVFKAPQPVALFTVSTLAVILTSQLVMQSLFHVYGMVILACILALYDANIHRSATSS